LSERERAAHHDGVVVGVEPETRFHLLPVERITNLNNDENRQSHRLSLRVIKYLAIDALKAFILDKALHVMRLTVQHTHTHGHITMNTVAGTTESFSYRIKRNTKIDVEIHCHLLFLLSFVGLISFYLL